jgi:hypothetical protein
LIGWVIVFLEYLDTARLLQSVSLVLNLLSKLIFISNGRLSNNTTFFLNVICAQYPLGFLRVVSSGC